MQAELTEDLSKPTTCIYGRFLLTQIVGLFVLSHVCEFSPCKLLTFKQEQESVTSETVTNLWCSSAFHPHASIINLKSFFFLLGTQIYQFHFFFELNDFKCINNVPYHIFFFFAIYNSTLYEELLLTFCCQGQGDKWGRLFVTATKTHREDLEARSVC